LSDITLVILSAGDSTRFIKESKGTKKQWVWLNNPNDGEDIPLWRYVTDRFKSMYRFEHIIITSSKDELRFMNKFVSCDDETVVIGGDSRSQSMLNALKFVKTKYVMITDMARACVPSVVIDRLVSSKDDADCIVPILDVSDTVVYKNETINRDEVKLIQTPQLSNSLKLIDALENALSNNIDFTDDSSAIKSNNGTVKYIYGDEKARKITYLQDLFYLKDLGCFDEPSITTFCGTGVDIHSFELDKKAVLGGVQLKSKYGFKAHSDGDVLIHSLIDAILGAIGGGDIGEFFPDTDDKYKGINSSILLKEIVDFVSKVGFEIVNVDISIICEIPKINPYKDDIAMSLSKLLDLKKHKINIKATTSEKMGFIGREEGIMVQSLATMRYKNILK
jgi:2-C-methyl-D-erythritol 4-phosphate cytidylyltransferase/2-C-methyl-D-erythritol 2,4-cyclodiphosphate synthase